MYEHLGEVVLKTFTVELQFQYKGDPDVRTKTYMVTAFDYMGAVAAAQLEFNKHNFSYNRNSLKWKVR